MQISPYIYGCYDLNCDGFGPVNNAPITPGDILEPSNGKLSITVKISKKKDDGDWWLHFGYDENNLNPVGFWSKSVLTRLADHANVIAWGDYDPAPWPAGLVGESSNKKCYQVSPYLDGLFYYGAPGGCTAL
uniref:Neprosin PEP catalytic domain-containing protein n=1 Tax=Oryza punctata TaxID=4537 RepID=A0A0E0L9H3_ORYPU